jgi:hypothetical protein
VLARRRPTAAWQVIWANLVLARHVSQLPLRMFPRVNKLWRAFALPIVPSAASRRQRAEPGQQAEFGRQAQSGQPAEPGQ